MTTISVKNLPVDARPETLKRIFSRYGRVKSVQLNKASGLAKKRSYGIVEMARQGDAERAVRGLNGQYFRGLFMRVEETPIVFQ